MDLTQLAILKDKLITAVDFKEPWDYFFEAFGECPDFFKFGTRMQLPLLEEIVAKVSQHLFQRKDIIASDLILTNIAQYHFFHGVCLIEGKMVTILFFDDIDMGLIGLFLEKNESVQLARFSTVKLEKTKDVFLAPPHFANRMTKH